MEKEDQNFERFAEENFKKLIEVLEDSNLAVENKMEQLSTTLFALLDYLLEEIEEGKKEDSYFIYNNEFYDENKKRLGFLTIIAYYDEKLKEKIMESIEKKL